MPMQPPLMHVVTCIVLHAHQVIPMVAMVGHRMVLVMDHAQTVALAALRDRAAAAPVHLPEMMERVKTLDGLRAHREAMSLLTIEIPVGFLVTFSIETGHPAGPCRHLTMSAGPGDDIPSDDLVMLVAHELGFIGGISYSHRWEEPACPVHQHQGRARAVHLVQPISITNAPANAD